MNISKRVLIINNYSVNENNSTGLTLRSIINTFSKNNLFEIYYFPCTSITDLYDIQSYKLNSKTKLIYNLISKVYKGNIRGSISNLIVQDDIHNRKSKWRYIKKIVLAYDDFFEPRLKYNDDILIKIKEFNPEIIYTLGASIFSLNLSYLFSKKYNIPIVLHHMDNWRETTYKNLLFANLPRKKLIESLNNVESAMNYGLTISEEMASKYEQISNKKYLSLMHTVDVSKFQNNKLFESDIVNIVYAGGLHLDRWKVLKDVENVINQHTNKTYKIKLNIFTTNTDKLKYLQVYDKETTNFHDFLPYNEVYKIYELADILLHVESFDYDLIDFTKYSLSTKIPEYMASGKPILCYAPMYIASSKYITQSNCGISVSNKIELSNALLKLTEDKSLRFNMGKNGILTALKNHSQEYKEKIMKIVFEDND
ncbi:MAG: glycosyltransferase family protein [Mobilitalea sp.]